MSKVCNFEKKIKYIIKGQDCIVLDYNGIVFDPISGTHYENADLLIRQAKKQGILLYILSNSTATSMGFEKNLDKLNYIKGIDYEEILTAGQTFRNALLDEPEILLRKGLKIEKKKIYIIGYIFPSVLEGAFFETTNNQQDADFAYLGIPQITSTEFENLPEKYKKGFVKSSIVSSNYDVIASSEDAMAYFYDKKMSFINIPIINANQDETAREIDENGNSVLLYRQGKFAKIHEDNGHKIVKIGKPYVDIMLSIFRKVKAKIQKDNINILFVGDNIFTDIKGASRLKKHIKIDKVKISSILCLNQYWKDNNKIVKYLMLFMGLGGFCNKLGSYFLERYMKTYSKKVRSIPDRITIWR